MTTALEALDERCRHLASLGGQARPSEGQIAELRASLGDASSRVRSAAARALGALLAGGPEGGAEAARADAIARELAELAVTDPHLWARQAAAGALARAPAAALERLRAVRQGGDDEARERAVRAMGHWGRGPGGATGGARARALAAEAALAEALGDPSSRVRAAAAEALGALPSLGPAVAALAAVARADADPAARVAALGALGDAGAVDGDDAFGAVAAAIDDEADEVAVAALEAALVARRPDRAARLLAPLVRRAGARSDAVGAAALRALGSLGAEASGALDAVLTATAHRSWAVREQAVEAFGAIAARDPAAAEGRLASLVASTASGARYLGLRMLDRLGEVPAGFAPALWAAALEDHDARTRELAREIVARAGAPSAEAIARLGGLLGSRQPSVRARAATIAGELGPAASPLAPALLRALPDPSRAVRRAAVEALRSLGEAARPGVPPALRRAFEGESTVVRAARATLKALAPGLPPELRARVDALAETDAPEAQLLALVDGVLPEGVRAELAHVARARARWYASLAPASPAVALPAAPAVASSVPAVLPFAAPAVAPSAGPAVTPFAAPAVAPAASGGAAREAVLAALDAATEAGCRRRRTETGPGWRQREAAWLLASAVRSLMPPG